MQKQKTQSKTCLELPWNHHGETELFLASSACHELSFMCRPSMPSMKHLHSKELDSASTGTPPFLPCLSSTAETIFQLCFQSGHGKANPASIGPGFCLYNSKRCKTKSTCETGFCKKQAVLRAEQAAVLAGSSAVSHPRNLTVSWQRCLTGMARELGKWAQCHTNRWAGVLGSQETVYVCQVRVLRAGFPWLSSLSLYFDKGTHRC